MRLLFVTLFISFNSLALETVICDGAEESYRCYTYSKDEPQYYENVINVHESDGWKEEKSDTVSQDSDYYSFKENSGLPYIFLRN
jgi:hypothetical protein